MAGKGKTFGLVALFLIVGGVGSQAIYYWMRVGYSTGQRTGLIRKLSVKGPPFCKYYSGEMVLQGAYPGQPVETWEFSLDDKAAESLKADLEAADKKAQPATLSYRQDKHLWWRVCNPLEYFVTSVK